MDFSIKPSGDSAVKVQFAEAVSPALNGKIRAFCRNLEDMPIAGVVEWVPAFDSVTIYYRPQQITYQEIYRKINELALQDLHEVEAEYRLIYVPVLYGGESGPDLVRVAERSRLSVEEVIAIHQQPECLVYMLGFLPGFPYLGGMDKQIATPRLDEPRRSTAAGSVGIAHEQTGIYPMESPGGWNIIGKTPLKLFDQAGGNEAFLFHAGDHVRFYEISKDEFAEIEKQVVEGKFAVKTGKDSC